MRQEPVLCMSCAQTVHYLPCVICRGWDGSCPFALPFSPFPPALPVSANGRSTWSTCLQRRRHTTLACCPIRIHPHPSTPPKTQSPRRHAIRSDPDARSLNSSHIHLAAPTLDRKFDCASESFEFFSTNFPKFPFICPTANIQSTSIEA